jgi:mono/diheme cytochrome c family protein
MLQRVGPQPLIEPEKLKTEADWIDAGRRVFEEAATPQLYTLDPKLIAQARSREFMEQQGATPFPNGTLDALRWAPTKQGVALTILSCGACHVLNRSDGARVPGAPRLAEVSRTRSYKFRSVLASYLESPNRVLTGAPPFFMGGARGMWLYQAYGVPWLKDDPNQRLKDFTDADYEEFVLAQRRAGAITRWNGSLLYPAKIPDLIGIKDRKYLDHTGTHLHRGVGDLMRYAAQVSFAEMTDFGPYHMLYADTKRVQARLPDEALYALALYIYSLKPPPNPNPFDEKAKAGEKIFAREGCAMCHTPPLYTNNKLTLAEGFTPPKDAPTTLDIVLMSVGADPGLALKTRKGTGYYKVPSLKGVWYRGHYLHDGSAASLEEMFDPERLKETHKPGGWSPPDAETRAIKGHEFGLRLLAEERAELIAFLRTL